jgi:hypothetical protein
MYQFWYISFAVPVPTKVTLILFVLDLIAIHTPIKCFKVEFIKKMTGNGKSLIYCST